MVAKGTATASRRPVSALAPAAFRWRRWLPRRFNWTCTTVRQLLARQASRSHPGPPPRRRACVGHRFPHHRTSSGAVLYRRPPREPVAPRESGRAPSTTSSASKTPAPRRRRRGRPRDRFRPRRDRRSPPRPRRAPRDRHRLRMHPKSKKKPPTAMIPGNDLIRPPHAAAAPRNAELRRASSPSGVANLANLSH